MSAPVARVPTVDVGTPPPSNAYNFVRNTTWETVEVHYHGLEDMPVDMGIFAEFSCLGCRWSMGIFPGGTPASGDGYMALKLNHLSGPPVEVRFIVTAKNRFEKQIAHCKDQNKFFPPGDQRRGQRPVLSKPNFAKRTTVFEALVGVGGTLMVEVRMTLVGGSVAAQPFTPENPLCKNILKKFNEEETSDVVFEVGRENGREDDSDGGTKKKARREPVHFYAHELVLRDSATTLAELAKSANNMTPIRINDVKPEVFRHLLYYVYGGSVSGEELEENAKDIIDAADKYGIVGLKLLAEACYARSLELSVDNVLDNLLYADSKNCALLKEMVVDFVAENGKDILGKVSFNDAPGSVVTDLLTVMTRSKAPRDDGYETMRVSALRKKLHEKGLDIDGSREAMIALLKENTPPVEEEPNPEPAGENPDPMEENP
ncbi:hypothetical protein ACHAXT_007246 [Thalassiosira profunda]